MEGDTLDFEYPAFLVQYTCKACGEQFIIKQCDDEPDEDIDLCRACLDVIFNDKSHGAFDNPWTMELIREARKGHE
jgi:hypothetical protein